MSDDIDQPMVDMSRATPVMFAVVAPGEKEAAQAFEVVKDFLKDLVAGIDTINQPVEGRTADEAVWMKVASFVYPENLKAVMTFLSEFAADLAVRPEAFGLEEGAFFVGAQIHLLENADQIEDAGFEEFHQVQSFLIERSVLDGVKLNGLRERVRSLEESLVNCADRLKAAEDNATANKVLNFEYRQMHALPQMVYAIVQSMGEEALIKRFEQIFDPEDHYEFHRIH